ncbi:hypothetical protein D3C84_710280 [compost metagenome]
MLQIIALDVLNESGIGHHLGAEHRHPPGHCQHPLAQCHRAHIDVPLGEPQLVPFAHQVAAAYLAELIGGQPADVRKKLEPGHGLTYQPGGKHGVAIDHGHHRIGVRHVPGDRPETMGQAVALAGAGNPHEAQLDLLRRGIAVPERLDQQFIGELDDGTHHRGRVTTTDGFFDHRAVHLRRGQRLDPKTGDQQKHVRRVGNAAEPGDFASVVGEHHIKEQ